jgi:GMP synthase (glutamine-hydrolysing)
MLSRRTMRLCATGPQDGAGGTFPGGIAADSDPFNHAFLARAALARAATRVINEVKGINRVVHDVSSTIEWE